MISTKSPILSPVFLILTSICFHAFFTGKTKRLITALFFFNFFFVSFGHEDFFTTFKRAFAPEKKN